MREFWKSIVHTLERSTIGFTLLGIPKNPYKHQVYEPQGIPDLGGEFYIAESGATNKTKSLKCTMLPPQQNKLRRCVYLTYINIQLVKSSYQSYRKPTIDLQVVYSAVVSHKKSDFSCSQKRLDIRETATHFS